MARKWLELAPWHDIWDDLSAIGAEKSNGTSKKENPMPHATSRTETVPLHSVREAPTFHVELWPIEDIYRTAGIMSPPRGYSVNKVAEMLNSERLRGLSKQLKRAAVLMALDAAGISIDQVRQDAKARQEALDSYEAAQKKHVEAEWARRAEEIIQIQTELESVKAHYMARISRNLEGVARGKATFAAWQTSKQQETQSMAEALDLCLQSLVSEPPISPHLQPSLAASAGGANSRPL